MRKSRSTHITSHSRSALFPGNNWGKGGKVEQSESECAKSIFRLGPWVVLFANQMATDNRSEKRGGASSGMEMNVLEK